jgi:hypothetical protein
VVILPVDHARRGSYTLIVVSKALPPTDDVAAAESQPIRRLPPTWRELHPGDDPVAEAMQFEHWRTAPPAVKMRELAALNEMALRLALAGLRLRYPSADEALLRRLLADLILGRELAASVYGPVPDEGRR